MCRCDCDWVESRQYSGASSLPEVVPSSSWEIKPSEIIICKHPDGSDWEIGSGGFGKVCMHLLPWCKVYSILYDPTPKRIRL